MNTLTTSTTAYIQLANGLKRPIHSLLTVQANPEIAACAQLASGEYVSISTDVDTDWNYYSKAWHRQYGPKRTVTGRWVVFFSATGEFLKQVAVPAYRGNYLLTAVVEYLALPKVKVAKDLKPAQLYPQASLVLLRHLGQVDIYDRQLAGTHLDYVVVYEGDTYHAATVAFALSGLRKKQRAQMLFERELFNYQIAREQFGFCHEGITSFCELNGLNIRATYSRAQLREAVSARLTENCQLFSRELRTTKIIGC